MATLEQVVDAAHEVVDRSDKQGALRVLGDLIALARKVTPKPTALSKAELAHCRKHGVDPVAFAKRKASLLIVR